jgi:hypothetical protein
LLPNFVWHSWFSPSVSRLVSTPEQGFSHQLIFSCIVFLQFYFLSRIFDSVYRWLLRLDGHRAHLPNLQFAFHTGARASSSFLQLKEHALDLVFLLGSLTAPVNISGSCHALICFATISLLPSHKLGLQVSFLTPRVPKPVPGFSDQGVLLVPVPWGPRWVLGLVLTRF